MSLSRIPIPRSANGYNRVVSIAARRRVGVAGLLGLLAGALVLMLAPGNPGALRLIGVGLLWWYAALAAPLAAVLLVAGVQRVSRKAESGHGDATVLVVAAWTSPAVLALIAGRLFSGGADAPALALAALVAPLIALLTRTASAAPRANLVAALAVSAGVGLILWANLLLFADLAGLLGLPRWAATIVAAAVALLAVELLRGGRAARTRAPQRSPRERAAESVGSRLYRAALRGGGLTFLYTSALGLLVLVAIVAVALAASPWGAWRDVASRPAITFGERDPWVTEGRTLAAPTALDFTEAHRVTALSSVSYRVLEPGRFREGELRAGETLSLRAGDRLVLDAGARVRFEAGKRVPGVPASGVAWADPPERGALSTVVAVLGAAVTLIGGALALVGSGPALSTPALYIGSGLLLALVLAALGLGVYGAYGAPGISIGAPALAAVFDLPVALVPGARGRALGVVSAVVLLLLFAATALALRDVMGRALDEPVRGDAGRADSRGALAGPIMTILLVAACAASMWGGAVSQALLAGFGLAASAAVPPRLVGDGQGTRLIGSLVGVTAFVGLAVLGSRLPTWADVVGTYPALAAVPLAWVAVRAEGVLRKR